MSLFNQTVYYTYFYTSLTFPPYFYWSDFYQYSDYYWYYYDTYYTYYRDYPDDTDYADPTVLENVVQSPNKTLNSLFTAVKTVGDIALYIEIPAICLAAYALYRLVKPHHVAPLYMINLLISDLIQVLIRPALVIKKSDSGVSKIFMNPMAIHLSSLNQKHDINMIVKKRRWVSAISFLVFYYCILVSIGFMVCVSLERYLMVSRPMWYRCRRTVKHSALISLTVWVAAAVYLSVCLTSAIFWNSKIAYVLESIYFFIPFPILIFVFVGTWMALSQSTVCHAEKSKILGIFVLVFCNYNLFFLPSIVYVCWVSMHPEKPLPLSLKYLNGIAVALLYISPLMDVLLYFFMGKHIKQMLTLFPCCRRKASRNQYTTTVSTVTKLVRVQIISS